MTEKLKDYSEIGRNGLSLLRDALIFALLILFLVDADVLLGPLRKARVDSVNLAGVTVKLQTAAQQSASAAESVAVAGDATKNALSAVERLMADNPALKPQLEPLLSTLRNSSVSVTNANEQLASAGRSQQAALAEAGKPPVEGWVSSNFLRGSTSVGGTATVIPPRPLNLRSAPGTDNSTLGVLFPGTEVRIVEGPRGTWVRVTAESPK